MTALNFQTQFAPNILDGLKPHTLRAKRKVPIKAGDLLQLYTGMRHEGCKLLGEALCIGVAEVRLNVKDQTVAIGEQSTARGYDGVSLFPYAYNAQFARADGFKRYEDMFAFFAPRAVDDVFTGDLIWWGRTFQPAMPAVEISETAQKTLRHMLGMDDAQSRMWGHRNRYCAAIATFPDGLLELSNAGYIEPGDLINDDQYRMWHATIAGMRAVGLPKDGILRTFDQRLAEHPPSYPFQQESLR